MLEELPYDVHDPLIKAINSERVKVQHALDNKQYKEVHHSKTGKNSQDVYYSTQVLGHEEPKDVRLNLFTGYHEGTELTDGKHQAITYPDQDRIPAFILPLIGNLNLDGVVKAKYLFINRYQLPSSISKPQIVFDWHNDLRRFGVYTVICNLQQHAQLQFSQLSDDDINNKRDGFLKPSPNCEIITVPIQDRNFFVLTGDARYHMVHNVIMQPGTDRESLALGLI